MYVCVGVVYGCVVCACGCVCMYWGVALGMCFRSVASLMFVCGVVGSGGRRGRLGKEQVDRCT